MKSINEKIRILPPGIYKGINSALHGLVWHKVKRDTLVTIGSLKSWLIRNIGENDND